MEKTMKYLILTLSVLQSHFTIGQTYYNPDNSIDLNLTIEIIEPFEPINYAEIAQDFNNTMQEIVARREALKNYYDMIAYETINSIQSNIHLTSDNEINKIIVNLKSTTISDVQILNGMLKSGQYGRDTGRYERDLRNVFRTFIDANQNLLYCLKSKHNSLANLTNESEKNDFSELCKETFRTIGEITRKTLFEIQFNLKQSLYKGSNFISQNQLLYFVEDCLSGNLSQFKNDYILKKERDEKARQEEIRRIEKANEQEQNRLLNLQNSVLDKRNKLLADLSPQNKLNFLKSEVKHLYKTKQFQWRGASKKEVMADLERNQYYKFGYEPEVLSSDPRAELIFIAIDKHLIKYGAE